MLAGFAVWSGWVAWQMRARSRPKAVAKAALALGLVGIAMSASAGSLPLERTADGGWRFGDKALTVAISGETGWPSAWEVDGARVLSGGKTPNTPWGVVSCAIDGKGAQQTSGRVKVLSVGTEDGNVLVSRMAAEGWRVALRLTLDTAARRASGRFEIERTGEAPVRLIRFWIRAGALALGEGGAVSAPARWPRTRLASAAFRDGAVVKANQSGCPLIAADGRGAVVTWLENQFLPHGDHGLALAAAHDGGADVTQYYYCQGFMQKGDRQTVGDSHILFGKGTVDEALGRLPEWFTSVGQVAPADRPAWMTGAVLYTICARGTRDTDRRDGRGFKGIETYLDVLDALGCNTIWLQPIEDRAPYQPRDYWKLQEGIGSVADYKSLVSAAHGKGMRVWNDIVPHGGNTNCVRFAEHPEWFAVQEDGTVPDYWAGDFNWPEWAAYMADVADYWMRLGGLDGFRVDAAFGARYPNWNPAIPYARASFARLQGGFRMQRALRSAVRKVNPQGAILAEAAAGAFNAISDATWDFTLGESVLPSLRERPAAEAVPLMRRWLHERQKTLPPGSLMLRYVETHDLLRARDVYGQAAATALGALVAWIGEGVPVINDGREEGAFEELRRIASIRHAIPELNGGETDYLAPEAPPGVFACLRKGPGLAIPLVNLNGVRTVGVVRLPDGRTFPIDLPPLGFTVLRPDSSEALPPLPAPYVSPSVAVADVPQVTLVEQRTNAVGEVVRTYRLSGCARWFAHTAEGAFESPYFPPHGDRKRHASPFYRFARGGDLLWDGRLHPFGFTPAYARVGGLGRTCAIVGSVEDSGARVSLLNSYGTAECLHVEVVSSADGSAPVAWKTVPVEAVRAPEVETGDSRLRTVVGGWMFEDEKLRVHFQRNGALRGVWRREKGGWRRLSGAIYLKAEGEKTYDQASDVESIVSFSRAHDGTLKLSFEGVLRNLRRAGKMPNGTSYHTTYTLGGMVGAVIETSFKVDAAGKGAATILEMESLDKGVKPTILGTATPKPRTQEAVEELKWSGGLDGGATFLFP